MKKIGVVIPACNEQDDIENCLHAIAQAQLYVLQYHHGDNLPEIQVLVVLDCCTDQTLDKVKCLGIDYLECDYACVGKSRHLGIQTLIEQGCDWLCCTDADSMVSTHWFNTMLQTPLADMICGIVELNAWQHLSAYTRQSYEQHYQDKMHHRHIHGANLSFSAKTYQSLGGFKAMPCHEDVDLVRRAEQQGLNIIWSNKVRVQTSSRLSSRVEQGFAHFLQKLEQQALQSETLNLARKII
ncbi:glycosyltransferase [Acinetobacter wanghuae]|uniref:glycosyltransferase n=1 Tax=Acinetobacter wanghuae TaxID=2662362 RepID=UPI003AF635D1